LPLRSVASWFCFGLSVLCWSHHLWTTHSKLMQWRKTSSRNTKTKHLQSQRIGLIFKGSKRCLNLRLRASMNLKAFITPRLLSFHSANHLFSSSEIYRCAAFVVPKVNLSNFTMKVNKGFTTSLTSYKFIRNLEN
jgi:hypothetical protein